MNKPRFQKRTLFLFAYLLFALLPIYWMLNMSFKTNEEIVSSFSLWPQDFTLANYITIFTDESWYSGYINSLIYVWLYPPPTLFRVTDFWAINMPSFGCSPIG